MRKAGLVVWEALQLAGEVVRPGATTASIDAVVDRFFDSRNATPLFKGVPGRTPFPASTCISVNEEVVHGIPGPRTLKEGDIVSVDTGCQLNGWCGDSAITFPVGQMSPEVQRLLDVTRGRLNLAIELMGSKTRWSEVAREMAAYVRDNGFSVVENFVGHGIGQKMHEEPQVPNFVSPQLRRQQRFSPGAGAGDRRRADGQHGHEKDASEMPDHWTQVDARWQAQRPFRAHDRHDDRRAVDLDRARPPQEELQEMKSEQADA